MSSDIGLLAELPVSRLPEHVCNLRNTLLARAGRSASEETSTIAAIKASVCRRLPKILEYDGSAMDFDVSQANMTRAVKAEIGQWIRGRVTDHYRASRR